MGAAGSAEEQLLEFLYACPVGLIECDDAGEIGMMNPHAMQHLLPLAGPRDPGNLFTALEQHAPEVRSIAAAFTAATGRICDGHRIVVDLGAGRRTPMRKVLSCTLVKLGPDRLMATLADISGQVAQEERLQQADAWFATLLDGVNDFAAIVITADGTVESANTCFTRQTGRDCAAIVGANLADILDADGDGQMHLFAQLAIAGRDGWHLAEGWQRRADGERYWCQRLVVARSRGDAPHPPGFSVVLRDVPPRGAAAEDLRRLLTCDHLTGAANRRHFSQTMAREQARWRDLRQPVALVMLDLDHFKAVNDRYGHPAGDVLLRRVTEACIALLPPRGLFARLGGEEFGVLLPHCDATQTATLAEELRRAIAAIEVATPLGPLRVTASLGWATLEQTDGTVDALLALADERLYVAKRGGRNRVGEVRTDAA